MKRVLVLVLAFVLLGRLYDIYEERKLNEHARELARTITRHADGTFCYVTDSSTKERKRAICWKDF